MSDLYGPIDEKKKRKKRKKAGSESSKESSLRDWFGRKGAKGKKKGWVDCNSPDGKGGYKSCGRSSGEKRKKYPACRPTPSACKERGKGKSWGKKAKRKSKKNEELYMDLEQLIQEELEAVLDEKRKKKKKKKKKAKRDACYHKVKSRYKVWPSAYASGALVKCRRVGAKNWGNSTKESLEIEVQNEIELILHERTLKEQKIDKEHVLQRFLDAYEEIEGDPTSVEDNVDFVIRDEFPVEPEIQKYLQSIRGELIQKASSGELQEAECPEGTKKADDGKCYPASPTDMGREYGQMPFEESGCGGDREHEATKTVKIVVREELQAVLDERKKKKKKKSAKDRMKCNSSRRIRKGEPGYGKKKFVVKACEGGTEKIIRYGDANMEIKKDSPARRKSFRARHNCKNPGSKLKARYWSCKKW